MTVHPRALDYPQSFLSGVIPDESELTAGQRIEPLGLKLASGVLKCVGCGAGFARQQ